MLTGCIETFIPDVDLDPSYVVVDGHISNLDPISVKLQRTVDPQTGASFKIIGATVMLLGDDGTEEILVEGQSGEYYGYTVGDVGVNYSLKIILPNARVILSDGQRINSGSEVGELSIVQSTQLEFIDGYQNVINGLDVNLYLNDETSSNKYFKWILEGTYEFHSPMSSEICYITDYYFGNFALAESISNLKTELNKKLAFIELSGRKFQWGYSLEVKQYSLNNDAFNYWKKIDDQQNNVGSVFDSPPAQILGNLHYVNEENIPVLGLFEASYVTTKRIFIKPTDFVEEPILEIAACIPQKPTSIPPLWCTDCLSVTGSTHEKPSYWPN